MSNYRESLFWDFLKTTADEKPLCYENAGTFVAINVDKATVWLTRFD